VRHRLLLLGFIFLAATSAAREQWSDEQREIVEANNSYIQAVLAEDLDLLMTFYTDDAVQLPPAAPAIVGKDAVRAGWAEAFDQVTTLQGVSEFDEIIVFGEWAYGRGHYVGRSRSDEDGTEYDEHLSFSGMWHRGPDGSWRISRDMWNIGVDE
jgi:ketosteroid isomerase-like protein